LPPERGVEKYAVAYKGAHGEEAVVVVVVVVTGVVYR